MLTDFIVARPEEAAFISVESNRRLTFPKFESKGLDNSVVAALWASLDPSAPWSSLEGEAHLIFVGGEAGPWVFNLPAQLISSLASLQPEQFLPTAEKWVKQPELAHGGWQGSDVTPAIEAMKNIASISIKENKSLLLCMSL